MTGMEIARTLQLPEEIFEAVYQTQPLNIQPDVDNPHNTVEALGNFAQQDNGLGILRFCLDWAAELKERYDSLGIPEKVFWDGVEDIAIWAEDYRNKQGVCGFAEWRWVAKTLSMEVFRLGRLQFEPIRLYEDAVCNGRLYTAGTAALSVHIPAGEPLDSAQVQEAMAYAPAFFGQYFQKQFVLFYCHSWLMSPQLKELLPEQARILQFQNLFYVYKMERQAEERVFGFVAENPEDYPEVTSLQKKMKALLLAGKSFGMGHGVCEISETKNYSLNGRSFLSVLE